MITRGRVVALVALALLSARESGAQTLPEPQSSPRIAPVPPPEPPPVSPSVELPAKAPLPDYGLFVDLGAFAQKSFLQVDAQFRIHQHVVATVEGCYLRIWERSQGVGGMVGAQLFVREAFRGWYLHPRIGFMHFQLEYETYPRTEEGYPLERGREVESRTVWLGALTGGYQFRWGPIGLRLGGGLVGSGRGITTSSDGFVRATELDNVSVLLDGALGVTF